MRGTVRVLAVAIAALSVSAHARSAAAEVRQVDAVGAVAVETGSSSRSGLRQAAVRLALGEAARTAAMSLLSDDPTGEGPPGDLPGVDPSEDPRAVRNARVTAALGSDPRAYALRYRILEDRGERAPLLLDPTEVSREYVVLVEVDLDLDLIRERLVSAGMAVLPSGDEARFRWQLEVVDRIDYREFDLFRTALEGRDEVLRAIPVYAERGRVVMELESSEDPQTVLRRLQLDPPGDLRVEPLRVSATHVVLRLRSIPADAESGAPAIDTSGRNRY